MSDLREVQTLTSECGHHCGVSTSSDIRSVGHCPCRECHGEPTGPIISTRIVPGATR